GDAAGAKGKGKGGKGKAPPGAPKLTRKERKKVATDRAKGILPKAPKAAPKAAAPALGQAKKKGKKRLRPGQAKRKAPEKPTKPQEETKAKKTRVRVRKRGAKDEAQAQAPVDLQPRCKKGHSLGHRSDNPGAYKNQACCDVCKKENLPKLCAKGKLTHFFHCSFCRFDICPNCAATWSPNSKKGKETELEPEKKQKKPKPQPQVEGIAGSRARREMWVPSEADAVNRAPLGAPEVVCDWIEGQPL
ncbi:unnamed protein product, partial [Effrenium voratum]